MSPSGSSSFVNVAGRRTEIPYRIHADQLFERDFAGEILDKYPDVFLVD